MLSGVTAWLHGVGVTAPWDMVAVGMLAIGALLLSVVVLLIALLGGVWAYMAFGKPALKGPPAGAMTKRFKEERERVFTSVLTELGTLSTQFDGWVATADPAVVKELLNTKEHTEHRSRIYSLARWLLPGLHGVLNMEGEEWTRHTRALLEIFHTGHINAQCGTIATTAARHAAAWQAGRTADKGVLPPMQDTPVALASTGGPCLLTAVRGVGMDVILAIGFGMDPTTPSAQALARDLSLYPELVGNFSQITLERVGDFLELQACTSRISTHTKAALAALPGGEGADKTPPNYNFLTQMAGAGFSLLETAREVNHIHGAHKAASFVIACSLHTLSRNPTWVGKLRGEWKQVLGGGSPDPAHQRPPTFADVKALPLSMAVIAECLRLHVVSMGVLRQTGKPMEIGGKTMPAGTEVVILLQALHTLPEFWGDNATAFDPTRFMKAGKCDVGPAERSYKYIPFLRGKRMCAGKALAELEFLVVLHAVLSTMDIRVGGGDRLVLKDDMYSALDETLAFRTAPLQSLDDAPACGPLLGEE